MNLYILKTNHFFIYNLPHPVEFTEPIVFG